MGGLYIQGGREMQILYERPPELLILHMVRAKPE